MQKCLCILCFEPNVIWLDFLQTFIEYDIYIIIDDNSTDYNNIYKQYTKINFIQISNDDCKINGFVCVNLIGVHKEISAWEKSFYYFSFINTTYDNIWFLEDDVFFYNEQTLIKIDSKYINQDLLSNTYEKNRHGQRKYWHWNDINIKFSPPYYNCMCCAVRISKNLILKIKEYASCHKTLFFLEALLPTLCKKYNLIYNTPKELIYITFRGKYTIKDITTIHLYHPLKNINIHTEFRKELLEK